LFDPITGEKFINAPLVGSPYSQHPPPNRARYPLDCPRIAHTASGAFLWVLTPYDRAKSVQGILVRSGSWDWNLFWYQVDWMGNRDGESFALSAKESATRTRGWVTTTISCVHPATQHGSTTRFHTQSRGTPIDAVESCGTGVNITSLVTACNNRTGRGGQFFPGAKKGGAINPPFKNCPKWNLHQPSLVFPHPLVFLVADELPLTRPSGLALEHEVQELLGDSEELRGLGGCAEGGL